MHRLLSNNIEKQNLPFRSLCEEKGHLYCSRHFYQPAKPFLNMGEYLKSRYLQLETLRQNLKMEEILLLLFLQSLVACSL